MIIRMKIEGSEGLGTSTTRKLKFKQKFEMINKFLLKRSVMEVFSSAGIGFSLGDKSFHLFYFD